MPADSVERRPPGGHSPPLDDARVDRGLRVAFGGAGEHGQESSLSIFERLGQTASRFQLAELSEETDPLHRPRNGTDDLPPQIGRYRIAGEVARGGVGAIYKARDEDLGRDVALKVLRGEYWGQPEMTQRFLEEAQIGAQLQHPGLVPVHEVGTFADRRPYFAMKLVKGHTLARLLGERKEPAEDRLRFLGIFEQICQPLAYAHARGVIHRDLKPSNVMVGAFGEVQVMDWGLAKVLARGGIADDRIERTGHTQLSVIETVRSGSSDGGSEAGSVLGTPAYMSPEQARGEVNDLDERTDVFGLGAILGEILTGDPPYVGGSAGDARRAAKRGDLDDGLARLDRCGADREVIDLAKRCLAFEPRERPKDARAVAREIRSYLDSLEERAHRIELRAAKTRFRATAAALLVLALGTAATSYLWVDREHRKAVAEASLHLERAVADVRVRMAEAEAARGGTVEWAAALDAVEAAERLVTPNTAPETGRELARLRGRIAPEIRAQELISELETIRDDVDVGDLSLFVGDARHATAFASFLGADVYSLPPAVVSERIRSIRASAEILSALEEWALLRRDLGRPWKALRDIVLMVDPDPWRDRVLQLLETTDPAAVQGFLESIAGEKTSAAVLSVLADSVSNAGFDELAERLLRHAIAFEPSSFRANARLGELLSCPRVGRPAEGLVYLGAARALGPRRQWTRWSLMCAFTRMDLYDQALEECSAMIGDLRVADGSICKGYLDLLEREGASFSPEALDEFVRAVELLLASPAAPGGRIWEVLGAARGLRHAGDPSSDVVAKARAEVARAGRRDPYVLNMLARVHFATGDRAAAIRTLEEAMALPQALPGWSRFLRAWRRGLLPKVVSYGSIDAALDSPEALVAEGAEWRYFRGTKLPAAGLEWTREDFDEHAWELGSSGFGYGDGDDRTTLADMQGNYSSLYVRRWVEIEDPGRFRRLLLHVIADDGFAAYLNGQLIGSARMDPDDLRLDPEASDAHEPVAPVVIDLTGKIRSGRSLLAMRGANVTLWSSDFSLMAELVGEPLRAPEDEARRIERSRAELEGGDSPALAAYLEGRGLERRGDFAAAAEKFREVVRHDRRSALPFQRLWETLEGAHGTDMARRLFREELEKGLPAALITAPLTPPGALAARVGNEGVELSIGEPFWYPDPRVSQDRTRWQVYTESGDSDRATVLDVVVQGEGDSLFVPHHRLRPDTAYIWKASWDTVLSGSAPSLELRFTTGHYPFETVGFDLTRHFGHDLVADPGDRVNDTIDEEGGLFIVDGFDGHRSANPQAQGLPADGVIGIHRLGDYGGPNAIQIDTNDEVPIRIEVTPRPYTALRVVVVSARGDAELPVTLVYSDGTTERRTLKTHDWFDDPGLDAESETGALTPDTTPLLNGLDRMYKGVFEDANDPALFETVVGVDARRELVAVVLEASELEAVEPAMRVSIFAVTGVWTGDGR